MTKERKKQELSATTIPYGFSQHFHVPATRAYKWCTNYEPEDLQLMHETGKRQIEKLSEDTIILTETFPNSTGNGQVTKKKLVRLYPARLFWTNTHIAGPNKYSQFLYQIVPESKTKSRLDFVGLQVEYRSLTRASAVALARKLRKEDSTAWRLLAWAMEEELCR